MHTRLINTRTRTGNGIESIKRQNRPASAPTGANMKRTPIVPQVEPKTSSIKDSPDDKPKTAPVSTPAPVRAPARVAPVKGAERKIAQVPKELPKMSTESKQVPKPQTFRMSGMPFSVRVVPANAQSKQTDKKRAAVPDETCKNCELTKQLLAENKQLRERGAEQQNEIARLKAALAGMNESTTKLKEEVIKSKEDLIKSKEELLNFKNESQSIIGDFRMQQRGAWSALEQTPPMTPVTRSAKAMPVLSTLGDLEMLLGKSAAPLEIKRPAHHISTLEDVESLLGTSVSLKSTPIDGHKSSERGVREDNVGSISLSMIPELILERP